MPMNLLLTFVGQQQTPLPKLCMQSAKFSTDITKHQYGEQQLNNLRLAMSDTDKNHGDKGKSKFPEHNS